MRQNRGQLAIGLAFAFTAVMAMFGLLFNSAMVAREKMKLQQTTDFAALNAADVERRNLNVIRQINQDIETTYGLVLAAVQLPYCALAIATNGAQCASFAAVVNQVTSKVYVPVAGMCEEACPDFEATIRAKLIQGYELRRDYDAAYIKAILSGANQGAYDAALDRFLTPQNLPHGLQRLLAARLGNGFSTDAVKTEYQNGGLADYLVIDQTYRNFPLFVDKTETRNFAYMKSQAATIGSPPTTCSCFPTVPYPWISVSRAKVVRDDAYTGWEHYSTHYLTGATYTPPNTYVDQTFAYLLKNPDSKRSGTESIVKDPDTAVPLRLFKVTDETTGETKTKLSTVAVAKPYGGTFPTPGNILNPLDFGDVGKEFKGAKLIGIADKAELLGYRIQTLDQAIPGTGETLVMEDFLH